MATFVWLFTNIFHKKSLNFIYLFIHSILSRINCWGNIFNVICLYISTGFLVRYFPNKCRDETRTIAHNRRLFTKINSCLELISTFCQNVFGFYISLDVLSFVYFIQMMHLPLCAVLYAGPDLPKKAYMSLHKSLLRTGMVGLHEHDDVLRQ